jgi:endoglucanase
MTLEKNTLMKKANILANPRILTIVLSVIYFSMVINCTDVEHYHYNTGESLLYNQVGFVTDSPKMALVTNDINLVIIKDRRGREVLSVVPAEGTYWDQSGDTVRQADFSSITKPGIYTMVLPEVDEHYRIQITDNPFMDVAKAALKAFYFNRTAIDIEPEFGGKWARKAGHPDTMVYVHSSAADTTRPEGTVISSPLGWYDAGDYNKYIVNSGISTYTMFRALADFHPFFKNLEVTIPETGSGVPDLLSETMFNYRWMLTMQDPHDGGVYHKLTNRNFDGIVMPHEAADDRFVVSKSTAAALNFAAVAAQASVVLKDYQDHYPGSAKESIEKAEMAWDWAVKNPTVYYMQPADIQTGAYGDRNVSDEFFWAAAELYIATGKQKYLDAVIEKYQKPVVPTWNQVLALGFMTLNDHYEKLPDILKEKGVKEDFLALVDQLTELSKAAPYGVSIQRFAWGSNSSVANEGMLKLFGYRVTGNQDYFLSALADLDYILGRNATGYSFVTGFGHKKVMNIHHRPSEADDVEEPVPGFLAGGPNTNVWTDCPPEIERSRFPAKSFVDNWCSYSTNEIAINWNAPLVYLAGGISAIISE